jgi:hypothetical protein
MILRIRPGEAREEFIRRVIATSGPSSDVDMAHVRQLLPSVKVDGDQIRRHEGESREDYIRRLVDAAPPLTEAQRARLRPILAPLHRTGP